MTSVDTYPPELYLLPHNEILYQRKLPRRLLFYCLDPGSSGGRTFAHSSHTLHNLLQEDVVIGQPLLLKIQKHGYLIRSGFPKTNEECPYVRTWSERFGTTCPMQAMKEAQIAKHQFDQCWWRDGVVGSTLMTEIVVNGFVEDYLLFPRIALDQPDASNAYREFLLGNGEALTASEIQLLLSCYLHTGQGRHWEKGDILLMDNLRFGHSREPYDSSRDPPRKIGILMAGLFLNQ